MNDTSVLAYIPQHPPFVMVDHVIEATPQRVATRFTIKPSHLFVDNGFFTESGLVENMAQTAAAGTGLVYAADGRQVPTGYIGALKNLVIKELPKVGDTITTTIAFLHQVMNAHVVEGKIFIDDWEIASCELKIFLQQN